MAANFMKKQEPGISAWSEAKEPPCSESEEENPDDEVSCDNCEKKMVQSSILKHRSHNEKCKSFYGVRFDEMKRKKIRQKKRKSRQKLGIQHELKKQRETYKLQNDMVQIERKKMSNQGSALRNSDRENIMHWKLAVDYFKNSLQMLDSEKQREILDFEKTIEDLYEMFRLEVRELY